MALNPTPTAIDPNRLVQTGRQSVADPKVGRVGYSFNCDFTNEATYQLDLSSLNQQGVFGVPRSLFCDNSSNPNEVQVIVQGTNMTFTVPAAAEGYFKLDSLEQNAAVVFYSLGTAAAKVTMTVYNYDVPPNVWYRFGALNSNTPLSVTGTMQDGAIVANQTYRNPVFIGGMDTGGVFRPVQVDNAGRLAFSSSLTISTVKIQSAGNIDWLFSPSAGNLATTASVSVPQVNSWTRLSSGNVAFDAASAINTIGDAILAGAVFGQRDDTATVGITENNYGPLRIAQDRSLIVTERSSVAIVASVNASLTSVTLLSTNIGRKGANLYNNGTGNLYLKLGTGASTASFTAKLLPGGYYEISSGYTGGVSGLWDILGGAVVTTELS